MSLFQNIFGSKSEIRYIKDIDKDLHEEITWFLRLEALCKEKVVLANTFAEVGNYKDFFSAIEHEIAHARSWGLSERFK